MMDETDSQDEVSEKVTVIVKTFERPELLFRLLNSIRRYYPRIPIIVADDSREHLSESAMPAGVKYLMLSFDMGVSAGRNIAISQVATPYFLLVDDDHVFVRQTCLERLLKIAECTRFSIVAMAARDYSVSRPVCRGFKRIFGTLDFENGICVHRIGEDRGIVDGFPVYDMVNTSFLAKRADVGKAPYDPNLKTIAEHQDFALETKRKGLLVTGVSDCFIEHRPRRPAGYQDFRKRQDFVRIFLEKHGISGQRTIGSPYRRWERICYGWPSKLHYYLLVRPFAALGRR